MWGVGVQGFGAFRVERFEKSRELRALGFRV